MSKFKVGDIVKVRELEGVVTRDEENSLTDLFPIEVLFKGNKFNFDFVEFTSDGRLSEGGKVVLKLVKRANNSTKGE